MENNQPKKKNAGLTALIALLLVITTVASCFGIYAWAKYRSSQNGQANAQIAKWNFDLKLNSGAQNAQDTAGPIDLADTIDFAHVKSGTIAPGTNGQFQVIVNTDGTEVDMQYEVTITLTNCPRNITFSRVDESNVTTELSAGGASNTLSRTLSFSRYLAVKPTNQNGRHVETITWNWPYESNADENWNSRDNDDNGLQVSMTITATGTQMLADPEASTVAGLAKSGAIKRWDTINYNPGNGTTASIDLPEGARIEGSKLAALNLPSGASINGTISASDSSDWVVLDVNQSTGEVLIMPRTVSETTLTLSGINGYNHAIEAINMVAGIYLNPAQATSSRSLTVEDVNHVENNTLDLTTVKTDEWNHRYGVDSNLNIVDAGEGNAPLRSYTSAPSIIPENSGDGTAPSFGGYCWLASRCLYFDSNYCGFYVRIVNTGVVDIYDLFRVVSGGGAAPYGGSYPVVPVVTLKSNIHLNDESEFYTETATATEHVEKSETTVTHHNWTIQ